MWRCDPAEPGINRKVFLQFFALPGLWGETLFDRFDQDKDGFVSQREFTAGMSICIRATYEEKLKFLFSLFDVDTDGFITQNELILMLANIAPLIHIQKLSEGEADSEQLAEQPPPGFVGIDENELNLQIEESTTNRIGSSHSRSRQAAHRVYETRCNKSFGMLSPCYGHHTPQVNTMIQEGGTRILPASHLGNKTQDPKQINDLDLFQMPVIKSTCTFFQFKLTRVDENSVFSAELPFPEPEVIIDFAQFVINTYKQRCNFRSDELEREISRSEPLKSSFLNTINARSSGLNFDEFKLWMKDLPIFIAMFGEMNYETIFEDFHSQRLMSTTVSSSRSQSQPPIGSCLPGAFCGGERRAVSPRPSSIPIYRKGFLMKRGRKFGGWKQRYFILRGKFLFCFKRPNQRVAKKSIFLPGCQIDTMNDFVMTRRYGFRITEPQGRFSPLRLYAASASECRSWVDSLKRGGGMVAVVQKYTFCEIIGKGKFSVVKRAINKLSGKQVAVKIIDKKALNSKQQQFLRTELQILRVVRHPNLVHIFDITEFREKVYIFMEYLQYGELNRYIRKRTESLPPQEIATVIRETVSTLIYLHLCGVIHRDLKPDNILVIPNENNTELEGLRIVDFGLSKLMKPTDKVIDACGTLSYVAPEVLQKNGYDCKVDIWSVGVIMYLLFRGQLPFDGRSKREMINQILEAPVLMNHKIWNTVPYEAKDLILKMLSRDIPRRLTAKEVLSHPFFKKYTQANLFSSEIYPSPSEAHDMTIRTRVASPSLDTPYKAKQESTLLDGYNGICPPQCSPPSAIKSFRQYESQRPARRSTASRTGSNYQASGVPTHHHASMMGSGRREKNKRRQPRSVSYGKPGFIYMEEEENPAQDEVPDQTTRMKDGSESLLESSRVDHTIQMNINSIRLSFRRAPGSYLQQKKGTLCNFPVHTSYK